MKYKLLRALCYLKELLAMLLCKLLGAVCRAFSPAYRGIWLVGERGTDARDNGYWFYRYLRTQHPELRTYYVITADSPDDAKIAALGGAVQRCSFRHYLLYYCADYLVGTHVQPCAPDLIVHYHLAAKGIHARGKQVFLQHGVTMSEMQWMHRENLYLDLFVCGAKPEYEYIRDTYGFASEVTRYLGFARWDHLLQAGQAPCKKMILLMPTWRGSHYPEGEAFLDTPYYKAFDSLLSSARLDALLEQYGYTLVVMPFKVLILTSALASVDETYYNAARIDGATGAAMFTRITLPMISPMIFYLVITGFIGAFKAYSDAVALFGTDLNAAGMNTIVGYIYDMLYGNSGGYPSFASAAAILLFAIVLTITCINLMISKKHVHY